MIELHDLPVENRLITHLNDEVVSDGGQWDMLVGLINKYGVVPKVCIIRLTHCDFLLLTSSLPRMSCQKRKVARTVPSCVHIFDPSYGVERVTSDSLLLRVLVLARLCLHPCLPLTLQ